MSKYKCIKSFDIGLVDENYEPTEDYRVIEKDSLWERDYEGYLNVVDESGLRLVNDFGEWIEIYPEDLKESFEALESEEE